MKRPPLESPALQNALTRIYVHEATATLITGQGLDARNIVRHDAVVLLSLCDSMLSVTTAAERAEFYALVLAPGARHSAALPAPGRYVALHVHLIHPRYALLKGHVTAPLKALTRAAFAHLDQALSRVHAGELNAAEVGALMEELVDVVLLGAPCARPLDARVPWVMRQLEADIDHPFAQLAAELRVSPSRLSHLFSQELGVSFRSYQSWARLQLAWEQVALHPKTSLKQIAHQLGYSDAAHLSRAFHQAHGVAPSTLRGHPPAEVVGWPVPRGKRVPRGPFWSAAATADPSFGHLSTQNAA